MMLQCARLAEHNEPVGIVIRGSVIVDLASNLVAERLGFDLNGALACNGFAETHLHLDKACLMDRWCHHDGTLASAISSVATAKADFTEEDIYVSLSIRRRAVVSRPDAQQPLPNADRPIPPFARFSMAAEQPAISQTLLGIRFFDAARSGEPSRRCVTPKFAELF